MHQEKYIMTGSLFGTKLSGLNNEVAILMGWRKVGFHCNVHRSEMYGPTQLQN